MLSLELLLLYGGISFILVILGHISNRSLLCLLAGVSLLLFGVALIPEGLGFLPFFLFMLAFYMFARSAEGFLG